MNTKIKRLLRWLLDRMIPRRYIEVHHRDSGNWCVVERHEVEGWIADCIGVERGNASKLSDDRQRYTTRPVWMTRHRFETLPDFEGY